MINTVLISMFLLFAVKALSLDLGPIKQHFDGYKGCFIIKDLKIEKSHVFGQSMCERPWRPCSTFKILNTLIGLETKSANTDTIFKWDGKKKLLREWEKDHTLSSAIKVSAVPVYQELARKIGLNKMKEFVRKVNYGNQTIGNQIDRFWLDGPLMINAYEQVKFLENLYLEKLPFSKKNMDYVKEIIVLGKINGNTVSGKTGSSFKNGKSDWGWFVGHIKTRKGEYVFATNIENRSGLFAKDISYKILDALDI